MYFKLLYPISGIDIINSVLYSVIRRRKNGGYKRSIVLILFMLDNALQPIKRITLDCSALSISCSVSDRADEKLPVIDNHPVIPYIYI